jgi:hypothetical protein
MSILPRKLRAVFTTAVLWAGAWILASVPVLSIVWLVGGRSRDLLEVLRIGLVLWGGFGAMNGIAFGVFLMLAERNRTLEQLTKTRVAVGEGSAPHCSRQCCLPSSLRYQISPYSVPAHSKLALGSS